MNKVELTTAEIYTISSVLNEAAAKLEKMAHADTVKGFNYRQIGVLEQEAKAMRELTNKLLKARTHAAKFAVA